MPVLDNPKHEAFAQALFRGESASQAYVTAGYSRNDGNSVRLKGNEKVRSRLTELQSAAAEKAGVSLESCTEEFRKDREAARAAGQIAAAIKATEHIAKMHHVYIEKREQTNITKIAEMSEEELERYRSDLAAQSAADRGDRAASASTRH